MNDDLYYKPMPSLIYEDQIFNKVESLTKNNYEWIASLSNQEFEIDEYQYKQSFIGHIVDILSFLACAGFPMQSFDIIHTFHIENSLTQSNQINQEEFKNFLKLFNDSYDDNALTIPFNCLISFNFSIQSSKIFMKFYVQTLPSSTLSQTIKDQKFLDKIPKNLLNYFSLNQSNLLILNKSNFGIISFNKNYSQIWFTPIRIALSPAEVGTYSSISKKRFHILIKYKINGNIFIPSYARLPESFLKIFGRKSKFFRYDLTNPDLSLKTSHPCLGIIGRFSQIKNVLEGFPEDPIEKKSYPTMQVCKGTFKIFGKLKKLVVFVLVMPDFFSAKLSLYNDIIKHAIRFFESEDISFQFVQDPLPIEIPQAQFELEQNEYLLKSNSSPFVFIKIKNNQTDNTMRENLNTNPTQIFSSIDEFIMWIKFITQFPYYINFSLSRNRNKNINGTHFFQSNTLQSSTDLLTIHQQLSELNQHIELPSYVIYQILKNENIQLDISAIVNGNFSLKCNSQNFQVITIRKAEVYEGGKIKLIFNAQYKQTTFSLQTLSYSSDHYFLKNTIAKLTMPSTFQIVNAWSLQDSILLLIKIFFDQNPIKFHLYLIPYGYNASYLPSPIDPPGLLSDSISYSTFCSFSKTLTLRSLSRTNRNISIITHISLSSKKHQIIRESSFLENGKYDFDDMIPSDDGFYLMYCSRSSNKRLIFFIPIGFEQASKIPTKKIEIESRKKNSKAICIYCKNDHQKIQYAVLISNDLSIGEFCFKDNKYKHETFEIGNSSSPIIYMGFISPFIFFMTENSKNVQAYDINKLNQNNITNQDNSIKTAFTAENAASIFAESHLNFGLLKTHNLSAFHALKPDAFRIIMDRDSNNFLEDVQKSVSILSKDKSIKDFEICQIDKSLTQPKIVFPLLATPQLLINGPSISLNINNEVNGLDFESYHKGIFQSRMLKSSRFIAFPAIRTDFNAMIETISFIDIGTGQGADIFSNMLHIPYTKNPEDSLMLGFSKILISNDVYLTKYNISELFDKKTNYMYVAGLLYTSVNSYVSAFVSAIKVSKFIIISFLGGLDTINLFFGSVFESEFMTSYIKNEDGAQKIKSLQLLILSPYIEKNLQLSSHLRTLILNKIGKDLSDESTLNISFFRLENNPKKLSNKLSQEINVLPQSNFTNLFVKVMDLLNEVLNVENTIEFICEGKTQGEKFKEKLIEHKLEKFAKNLFVYQRQIFVDRIEKVSIFDLIDSGYCFSEIYRILLGQKIENCHTVRELIPILRESVYDYGAYLDYQYATHFH